MILRNGVLTTV